MKTTIHTIIVLMLILGVAQAQNFKTWTIPFIYLRPAAQPLEGQFNTYSIRFENDPLAEKYGITSDMIARDYIDLPNYAYVPKNGDFEVLVFVSGGQYVGQKIEEREVTVTRKGTAVKEKRYQYRVSYTLTMSYQILDGKRKLMREETIFEPGSLSYAVYGRDSRSKNKLASDFRVEKDEFVFKSVQRGIKYGLQLAGDKIKDESCGGYVYMKEGGFLSVRKGEKYGVGEYFNSFAKINAMVEDGSLKVPTKEALLKLDPILKSWKAVTLKFDPSNKKERTQYTAATFSLAKIYTLLGDIESAEKYYGMAKGAAFNGKSQDYVNKLAPVMDDMKARLLANMNVPQTYAGTFDAKEVAAQEMELTRSAAIKQTEELLGKLGTVYLNSRDSVKGYLKMGYSKADLLVGITLRQKESVKEAQYFPVDSIRLVRMGKKLYIPAAFTLSDDLVPTVDLLEILVFSKELTLLKFDKDGYEDHLLWKSEDGKRKMYNMNGLRFSRNFPKSLSKLFEDCPTVSSKAASGAYKPTEASLRELCEDHKNCQ